jgi:xanthine/uracil permease
MFIAFGGTLLRHSLNVEHWQQMLASMAFTGLFVSGALLFIISKWFEIISDTFPPKKLKPYYTVIEFGLIGLFAVF